jgi:hypothetical protein
MAACAVVLAPRGVLRWGTEPELPMQGRRRPEPIVERGGAPDVLLVGDVSVKGYFRRDGTYVQPHRRSAPDGNRLNNYSTKGHVNPYTGQPGTKNPFNSPGSGWGGGTGSGVGRYGGNVGGTQPRSRSRW